MAHGVVARPVPAIIELGPCNRIDYQTNQLKGGCRRTLTIVAVVVGLVAVVRIVVGSIYHAAPVMVEPFTSLREMSRAHSFTSLPSEVVTQQILAV